MSSSSRKAKRDADEQLKAIDVTSRDLDNDFKRLMLRAGYVQLALCVVLVVVAMALAATAVIGLVRGSYWAVPPAGGSCFFFRATSSIGERLISIAQRKVC
jgi:hypothetical protein